jgi:hypothetical protein
MAKYRLKYKSRISKDRKSKDRHHHKHKKSKDHHQHKQRKSKGRHQSKKHAGKSKSGKQDRVTVSTLQPRCYLLF